jgi:putative ABC transport system permease protein
MFKNYLVTSLRSFARNRLNTWISVAGLSIGMATSILIILFVQDEFKYDQFNKRKDKIYRLVMDLGPDFNNPLTPMPLAPVIEREFPVVEKAIRIIKNRDQKALFVYGDKRFYETDFMYADPGIIEVFTFNFISGDPSTALKEPNTAIVDESTARKYFGSENPINKIIQVEGQKDGYKITGLVKDFPPQSHLHFNFLVSFSSAEQNHKDNWLIPYMFTYIVVKPNSSIPVLEKNLSDLVVKNFSAQVDKFTGMSWQDYKKKNGHGLNVYLQPLTAIHLHSHFRVELEPNGNYIYVYLFGIIAAFILLLSSVNFINLTTASASVRAKEIGVRKVSGALKINLIRQFMLETLLLCSFSMMIALAIVYLMLPVLNDLTGKAIFLQQLLTPEFIGGLTGMLITVTLLTGIYPAFYLSKFKPVEVLKGTFNAGRGGITLRRVLIVSQFAISVGLIIGVIVVNNQLRFMSRRDLGFQKEQLIVLPIHGRLSVQDKETIKNNLLKYQSIKSLTMVNYLPGKEAYENQDVFIPEGKSKDQFVPLWFMRGDWDIVKTMGFHLLKGRDFSAQMTTDSFGYILNETAVKQLGWKPDEAIGKTLSTFGNGPDDIIPGHVIGIVKDFHFEDFTHPIKPMLLGINPNYWSNIVVRVSPEDIQHTLSYLQQQWKSFQPKYSFEYFFVDQNFSRLWMSDKKLSVILGIFTAIAIGIACIGLFGLSMFAIERRTKEIGIRKVMGASFINIMNLLSKEYLILVMTAFVIASPVAGIVSNYWLREFSYRTKPGALMYVFVAIAAVLITLFTISYTAIKSALSNPVKSLRSE